MRLVVPHPSEQGNIHASQLDVYQVQTNALHAYEGTVQHTALLLDLPTPLQVEGMAAYGDIVCCVIGHRHCS